MGGGGRGGASEAGTPGVFQCSSCHRLRRCPEERRQTSVQNVGITEEVGYSDLADLAGINLHVSQMFYGYKIQ